MHVAVVFLPISASPIGFVLYHHKQTKVRNLDSERTAKSCSAGYFAPARPV